MSNGIMDFNQNYVGDVLTDAILGAFMMAGSDKEKDIKEVLSTNDERLEEGYDDYFLFVEFSLANGEKIILKDEKHKDQTNEFRDTVHEFENRFDSGGMGGFGRGKTEIADVMFWRIDQTGYKSIEADGQLAKQLRQVLRKWVILDRVTIKVGFYNSRWKVKANYKKIFGAEAAISKTTRDDIRKCIKYLDDELHKSGYLQYVFDENDDAYDDEQGDVILSRNGRPFLNEGITGIAGFTGVGKTQYCVSMAITLATGIEQMGISTIDNAPVNVVCFDFQQTSDTLSWSFRDAKARAGLNPKDDIQEHLTIMAMATETSPTKRLDAIIKMIEGGKYRVVFIDTIQELLEGFDINDQKEAGTIALKLNQRAIEHHIAIVFTEQLGEKTGNYGKEMGAIGTALRQYADRIYKIERNGYGTDNLIKRETNGVRIFCDKSRNRSTPPEPFAYVIKDGHPIKLVNIKKNKDNQAQAETETKEAKQKELPECLKKAFEGRWASVLAPKDIQPYFGGKGLSTYLGRWAEDGFITFVMQGKTRLSSLHPDYVPASSS